MLYMGAAAAAAAVAAAVIVTATITDAVCGSPVVRAVTTVCAAGAHVPPAADGAGSSVASVKYGLRAVVQYT